MPILSKKKRGNAESTTTRALSHKEKNMLKHAKGASKSATKGSQGTIRSSQVHEGWARAEESALKGGARRRRRTRRRRN